MDLDGTGSIQHNDTHLHSTWCRSLQHILIGGSDYWRHILVVKERSSNRSHVQNLLRVKETVTRLAPLHFLSKFADFSLVVTVSSHLCILNLRNLPYCSRPKPEVRLDLFHQSQATTIFRIFIDQRERSIWRTNHSTHLFWASLMRCGK